VLPNVKIVGSRVIQCSCTVFKDLDVSSVMVHTKPNIIVILDGVAKQTSRLTHFVLKLNRASLAPTPSSV